jgi:hypothetical protein
LSKRVSVSFFAADLPATVKIVVEAGFDVP